MIVNEKLAGVVKILEDNTIDYEVLNKGIHIRAHSLINGFRWNMYSSLKVHKDGEKSEGSGSAFFLKQIGVGVPETAKENTSTYIHSLRVFVDTNNTTVSTLADNQVQLFDSSGVVMFFVEFGWMLTVTPGNINGGVSYECLDNGIQYRVNHRSALLTSTNPIKVLEMGDQELSPI